MNNVSPIINTQNTIHVHVEPTCNITVLLHTIFLIKFFDQIPFYFSHFTCTCSSACIIIGVSISCLAQKFIRVIVM